MRDDDNPGVEYAKQYGVDVEELHQRICDFLDKGDPIALNERDLQVLKACLEVACEF